MKTDQTNAKPILLAIAVALALPVIGLAADAAASAPNAADPGPPDFTLWTKPAWLSDLSFNVKESYDDNVLGVSGNGLPVESSWVNSVSTKIGLNFVPLLGSQKDFTALSLAYNPEWVHYENAQAENYIAHRVSGAVKAKVDNITISLDNAFVYNDGNKIAPTYAENQLAGAAGNQDDKYRNNFAHSVARERRNQDQDRYTAFVQIDEGNIFVRPISQLIDYDLNTRLFNTSFAPYKGYQDYIDRYDINGGADLGFKLTKDLAVTVGYRDGFQHQDQFALAINSDRHFSSNHYQRLLFGLEGKLTSWLTVKVAAGPDFRDYNPSTPISDHNTTRYYGEGSLVAALGSSQTLTLSYKQWEFVSSTGLVPYDDTTVSLVYHWSLTKEFGFDLGARYLEANYTLGNDTAGSAPSLRDDIDYGGTIGFSYSVTKQIVVNLGYALDDGRNNLDSLPANLFPGYRDFTHSVTTLGATYKF